MDGLDALLDGPRSRGAFVLRVVMDPPWSVRVEDDAPLSLVAVLRGSAVCHGASAAPATLQPGDVALLAGGDAHVFASDARLDPHVRILPGQRCVDPLGELVDDRMAQGIRRWGNTSGPGETLLLIATWHEAAEVSRPLLAALPGLLVRRRGEWDPTIVDLLATEADRTDPGQAAVVDRLLDVALVQLVRDWATSAAGTVRGLSAHDPAVDAALRAIHDHPEQPWTLAALAARAHLSRAAFARRFTAAVGEPAIAYLTRWRLWRAADLLLGSRDGIAAIARDVGYGSPFSFSTAFARQYGVSPAVYRRRGSATPAAGAAPASGAAPA